MDTTYGFPFSCRVTSIKRDYTPVLPTLDDEITRVEDYFEARYTVLHKLRRERGADWREPLDLVEATSLLPTCSTAQPTALPPDVDHIDTRAALPHDSPDDVSIIGSDEGEHNHSDSDSDSDDEEELNMLLTFEHMLFDLGELRNPVVNVWYDLDTITEIVDPVHFLEDVKRLLV